MFDDLLAANRRYASGFQSTGLPGRAAKHFCLVTCMDTRIEPLPLLGLGKGDAKILRNAGGRVTPDVLRGLVLATTYLDVRYVAIMQHTDCALGGRSDSQLREGLSESQAAAVRDWDFLAMSDPDAALVADVEAVRSCRGLAEGVTVEGWRYNVETGVVERVVEA